MDQSALGIRHSRAMLLQGAEQADETMLAQKRRVLMGAIGELSDGEHLVIEGVVTTAFSAGMVAILVEMAASLAARGCHMGFINISSEAVASLRSHPGGDTIRVCTNSTEVSYPELAKKK